jgi:eukaryotic-like serine/threonine-protein kinase
MRSVTAVAYGQLNNQPIAITGSDDTTVRVWNLTTHQQIGQPLTGHTSSVSAVAYGQLNNQPIAITCGEDETVRIWSLGPPYPK